MVRKGPLAPGSRHLLVSVLAVCMACSGCVGRNFKAPPSGLLVLGTTSSGDVVRALGEPYQQRTRVFAGGQATNAPAAGGPFDPALIDGSYTLLVYTFADAGGAPLVGGISPARTMALEFWNDRLFYYSLASSFAVESTNFDETQVSKIEKGKTSQRDVRDMLGDPSGRAIYPEIQLMNGEKYVYSYSVVQPREYKAERKRLEILFDGRGIVVDLQFVANTVRVTDYTIAATFPLVMPRAR
ncbi:MAG TPA: outer membrane protein assembly factor BamE [Alphaproteobacteria bacterium]